MTAVAVYTDVDGTLRRGSTIFDLLRYDADRSGRVAEGERFLRSLREAAAAGTPREVTNRRYFAWWRGRAVDDVARVARDWAAAGGPWAEQPVPPVLAAVERYRRAGARVVAVSAAFEPALVGVRERWVEADVLATRAVVRDGRYTGDVVEPLVGEAKARAVRAHAATHGIPLERCAGFGDHASDLPFLRAVGTGTRVGPGDRLVPVTRAVTRTL
ncbi:HAD superfamily phosphoserine phosphatase-like hydrolase [Cellulosimicrobium cellulans J34]|nr:HAD superfamily phosphoserine phosphatase-like hydrolase [Cellulosimicrobium cellulans J34]SMF42212.1 Haloacid Dehalogenase superfamily, subfamily IB, phosphoserine phosphatase-like [Cellulosimicrobium cellulans J1]